MLYTSTDDTGGAKISVWMKKGALGSTIHTSPDDTVGMQISAVSVI